jgi:hypothetical protein
VVRQPLAGWRPERRREGVMMFDDANQPDEDFRLASKREEAKKALHTVIVTALHNCSGEVKIDPASYPIIATAIIDQITQPHVTWALKELGKSLRMI